MLRILAEKAMRKSHYNPEGARYRQLKRQAERKQVLEHKQLLERRQVFERRKAQTSLALSKAKVGQSLGRSGAALLGSVTCAVTRSDDTRYLGQFLLRPPKPIKELAGAAWEPPQNSTEVIRIGRLQMNEIQVHNEDVSGIHVEIRLPENAARIKHEPKLKVRDISGNGTGICLPGGDKKYLKKNSDTSMPNGSSLLLPMRVNKSRGKPNDNRRIEFHFHWVSLRAGRVAPAPEVRKPKGAASMKSLRSMKSVRALRASRHVKKAVQADAAKASVASKKWRSPETAAAAVLSPSIADDEDAKPPVVRWRRRRPRPEAAAPKPATPSRHKLPTMPWLSRSLRTPKHPPRRSPKIQLPASSGSQLLPRRTSRPSSKHLSTWRPPAQCSSRTTRRSKRSSTS